jgi:hypothetical protein
MMFERGMKVSRIGDEPVDGVVLQVTVDMGDEPGTIVEVAVGDETRKVFADACVIAQDDDEDRIWAELHAEQHIDAIGRDGDTMPSGSIDHVAVGLN